MKNLTSVVLTTTFTLLSMAAFAVDIPEFTIKNEGPKSFVLYLDKVLTDRVQVRILDAEKVVLFSEAIKKKGPFSKKFNLSKLPMGRYTVEIEDAYTLMFQPVEILDSSLMIDAGRLTAIYKPVIKSNGQQVDLTFLQLEDAVTQVEIFDEKGFSLYKEAIVNKGSITRRYDISQLLEGEYVLRVAVKGKVYFRNFTVDRPAF